MTTTTAQWVFELAMSIMDELDEASGEADIADNAAYKNRSLAILNMLQAECYPASDTYPRGAAGIRPAPPDLPDFGSVLALDDALCRAVLPYGLAAHLLLDENRSLAAYFNQRYQEQLALFKKRGTPAAAEPIEDVYGGIGFESSARW